LIKYFAQVGDLWRIAPEIRAIVRFRQLNLLADFAALGTFDVFFAEMF
jgi:chemotaxis protein methyltransferase CheR